MVTLMVSGKEFSGDDEPLLLWFPPKQNPRHRMDQYNYYVSSSLDIFSSFSIGFSSTSVGMVAQRERCSAACRDWLSIGRGTEKITITWRSAECPMSAVDHSVHPGTALCLGQETMSGDIFIATINL